MVALSASLAFANDTNPSFDCKAATRIVERLICADPGLAEQDAALAQRYALIRDSYDQKRRDSFVTGQRNWLRLRSDACLLGEVPVTDHDLRLSQKWLAEHSDGNDDEKAPFLASRTLCLRSVYEERSVELSQQRELQSAEQQGVLLNNEIDIDSILDAKRPLANYYPESMSMLHGTSGIGPGSDRLPQTCRELYTLNAGDFNYSSDNIGMNSYNYAYISCLIKILSAQFQKPSPSAEATQAFLRFEAYSGEFTCLVDCDVADPSTGSFSEAARSGRLRIISTNHQQTTPRRLKSV
jgi:uncharacterized protein YecT (DUF1311 family)